MRTSDFLPAVLIKILFNTDSHLYFFLLTQTLSEVDNGKQKRSYEHSK